MCYILVIILYSQNFSLATFFFVVVVKYMEVKAFYIYFFRSLYIITGKYSNDFPMNSITYKKLTHPHIKKLIDLISPIKICIIDWFGL